MRLRKLGTSFCIHLVPKSRIVHLTGVFIPFASLADFLCTHPDINSSFLNMAVNRTISSSKTILALKQYKYVLFTVGNYLSTTCPLDLYYWPILTAIVLKSFSLFIISFSTSQRNPSLQQQAILSLTSDNLSHSKSYSIWKEII